MIVFDVSINGRSICSAGVGHDGVLTAMAFWCRPAKTEESSETEQLEMLVSGMPGNADVHLEWANPKLHPGDVITIDIVERDHADPPRGRSSLRARVTGTPDE